MILTSKIWERYPRHPVIPPEVQCFGYLFGVQIPKEFACESIHIIGMMSRFIHVYYFSIFFPWDRMMESRFYIQRNHFCSVKLFVAPKNSKQPKFPLITRVSNHPKWPMNITFRVPKCFQSFLRFAQLEAIWLRIHRNTWAWDSPKCSWGIQNKTWIPGNFWI